MQLGSLQSTSGRRCRRPRCRRSRRRGGRRQTGSVVQSGSAQSTRLSWSSSMPLLQISWPGVWRERSRLAAHVGRQPASSGAACSGLARHVGPRMSPVACRRRAHVAAHVSSGACRADVSRPQSGAPCRGRSARPAGSRRAAVSRDERPQPDQGRERGQRVRRGPLNPRIGAIIRLLGVGRKNHDANARDLDVTLPEAWPRSAGDADVVAARVAPVSVEVAREPPRGSARRTSRAGRRRCGGRRPGRPA